MVLLTSGHNPKIKEALKLAQSRSRHESGLFLIEGYRELKKAVDAGVTINRLFVCPELFLGENEGALIEEIRSHGGEVLPTDTCLFEKLSYRDRPDGLIAVAVQMRSTLSDLEVLLRTQSNPFIVVAEAIEKPGNLGTILRSADAAGADAVVVCDRCTDIYNPNVVRASVGTLFTLPVFELGSQEVLALARKYGIKIVAATPSAHTEFTRADLTGGVAIVVGTEQLGLTPIWMEAADIRVKIPMRGAADSLNVATATTLLLYEVLRQRCL